MGDTTRRSKAHGRPLYNAGSESCIIYDGHHLLLRSPSSSLTHTWIMSYQAPPPGTGYPPPDYHQQQQAYVAPPPAYPPPTMQDQLEHKDEATSRGDGFWKGWCV
jgi:hypothetical protein